MRDACCRCRRRCRCCAQVNIYCDCPLWPDDSMCSLRACSVCECDSEEVPAPWLAQERRLAAAQRESASKDKDKDKEGGAEAPCNSQLCKHRPRGEAGGGCSGAAAARRSCVLVSLFALTSGQWVERASSQVLLTCSCMPRAMQHVT